MKQQFLDLNGLTELVTYLKKSITEQKEILPYASNKLFPSTGNVNTIYIDTATKSFYRWDSSNKKYEILAKAVKSVSISESTENGKITLTVDGNKTTVPIHGLGSAAYTNSSAYSPAGHTHTKAQVGLGNVDNTADANKSVKHAITADSATTAGTATNISGQNAYTDDARHVWFSVKGTETQRAYNDNFKYNPVKNLLTTNITGSAASASNVPWTGVTGKPSTFTPSAHNHNDSTITSLNASKLFGTIDIARLPHGALERCVIVEDDTARFALTTAKIQLGDTVKVNKTQKMYFVIDDSKLNSEAGYAVYTAGTATSVPWSGVTGKPSTFTPSAHTHPYLSALSVSGKTITYTKGDGTTGTITTQDTWRGIQNNLTSTSTTDSLSAAQGKILKGLVDGKLSLSGGTMTGNISYKGSKATYEMIKFIDNSSDTYGNGIAIGGGGLTIIGGGESSDVIKSAASSGGEERLVLANDGAIEFYTNCQDGIDKSVHTTIDNTGLFSGTASSANLINCAQLTNQDLNTLKDPGKFYYAAGSNSCTNTGQASGTAFGLYVGRNAAGYRYQKMITTGNLIYYRTYNSTSWGVWSTNIDSTNYTSYAPTKTGTGASGTWGISVTGNAATATKLATARSINGTNFDGSGNITTATWGTARNITIGSTKKSVNGGADVSWSLSEIGAAAASHSHSYLPLSGGTLTGNLNLKPASGEGGEIHLDASTANRTENGIILDQQGGNFRIFGAPSADGTTKTGSGTPLVINPYSKTITGGYTLTGNLSGNASSASSVPWTGVTGRPSSLPASDVYAWAKASTKPSYTKAEVGLGSVDNTADSAKSVKYATSAGSANAVAWANVSGKPSITGKQTRTLTASGPSGWKDAATDQGFVPDMAFMAYWNGAYSGSSSNLAYCNRGAFGTIVTKNAGDYATASHTHYYAGSSSAGGAATSANKLATARTVSGGTDVTLSFNYDGSGNSSANIGFYSSSASVGNTNNYPFHRFAKLDTITGSYVDKSTTFFISQDYSGGGFGIVRITLRTNDSKTVSSVEVKWLVRSGLNADSVQVGLYNVYGKTYADAFFKTGGSYAGTYFRAIASGARGGASRTWVMVSSSETNGTTTSDPKTSAECYASIASAGTKLHNQAYSATISGSDTGTASYANSAGSVAWANVSGRPSSMPASDVPAWAKASSKPSYSWGEITGKPSTFTPASHTHNYAGSSSAGGNANAAVKLATARKIGNASFDGTANITLSQMGLNVPVEITKADYLAKKKAGTLNANTYYNVIDEYDSANVINDSSVTANSAFSSTKSEKTYAKKSAIINTTLTASKWTGSSAPYTYVLPVSGATTSNIVEINYASNASSQAIEAYQNAMLADGGQTTNQITIKATEKPTVDIPITIVIRNDL